MKRVSARSGLTRVACRYSQKGWGAEARIKMPVCRTRSAGFVSSQKMLAFTACLIVHC